MSLYQVSDLIDRSRTYIDDDHNDNNGYIVKAKWLSFFNTEYRQSYRKWVRNKIVSPPITDTAFSGITVTITGVLAVIGVAQNWPSNPGIYPRILKCDNVITGHGTPWASVPGFADRWSATGASNDLVITLDPQPQATDTFFVRWTALQPLITDVTQTVELPDGMDEQIVIGMARRAHIKDGGVSRGLEMLKMEADSEMNFSAFGQIEGGARMKNRRHSTPRQEFSLSPLSWYWPGAY